MDASTLVLVIIGVVLAVGGIAALVYAFNVRVKTLQSNIDQQTSLALTKTHLDNEMHAHELTQLELSDTRQELDHYKEGVHTAKGVLLAFGMVQPDTDLLQLTPADIILEGKPMPVATHEPGASELPTIPGITPSAMRKILVHASNRTGTRANRPFSRSHMIKPGICNRSQLDALVKVLIDGGYLERDTAEKASPLLTPRGQHLLDLARTGQI